MASPLKKISDKLNLGTIFKKNQVDKTKGQINKLDNETKVQTKSTEDTNRKVKRKTKRKVNKICIYCLSQFTATRVDAKYCTDSCRQSVYEKGGDVNKYQNPSEHFFLAILKNVLTEILENEYKKIHVNTLYKWRAYLDVGRHLYDNYMDQNSQFTEIYFNEVVPTFKAIGNLFRMSTSTYTIYNLKPAFRERWQWVVDTLNGK